jgi:hypothetical protein
MPSQSGPKILGKENLVFSFDVGDVQNSYIGEPTSNLIPAPGLNAYPTFGNYWYTYNTNQYCGNNGCAVFWDIPAIASVSNNIVTTVSSHQIRSFDVIRPNATGGGVVQDTDYFAKKIDDYSFTLHAYNSSQDGSQGYINPATGHFKVHDSVWLDQRISVNASSFPTKWWGAPHLPNSAIVKEIIPKGFSKGGKKTDCIRLHWFRSDAADGMSYGPDAYVTIGSPVTVSFYARAADSNAVGQYINFSNYNYGGPGGYGYFGMTATWGQVGEWVRNSYTFTPTHNYLISYWFPSTGNMKVDIANIQIEQKSHATQFIAGTRSVTESLKPLIGNSTIDLTNVSFDSKAQMVLDGTNDYISVTNNSQVLFNNSQSHSFSLWIKKTGNNSGNFAYLYDKYGTTRCPGLLFYLNTNTLAVEWWSGTWTFLYTGLSVETNVWNFITVTINAAGSGAAKTVNVYVYKSTGLETATVSSTNDWDAGSNGSFHIGRSISNDTYFNGYINQVCTYNRALTAAEVQTNYDQSKKRFNLS